MKPFSFWQLLAIAVLVSLAHAQRKTTTKKPDETTTPPAVAKTLETKFFKGYRIVNWCVTGKDEPKLHEWPFNQFVPLIKRHRRYKQHDPDNNRYRVEIKEIYSRMPWVGATANCRGEPNGTTKRPHFYPNSPNGTTEATPFLGPWCEPFQECYDYGTNRSGLNIGTFDCDNQVTEYSSTLEPPPTGPGGLPEVVVVAGGGMMPAMPMMDPPSTTTPKPLLHWNLSDALPRAPECSDTDVTGCRPHFKNASALKILGRLHKTVHITVYAEERRRLSHGIYEKWIPQDIEGLLIQANHNPFGIGLPTGQFFNGEFHCLDCGEEDQFSEIIPCRKRPSIEVAHPTIMAFHHLMPVPRLPKALPISLEAKYAREPVGKRCEVHGNFRWFSPPCTQTTRLEFTLMVVRSFKDSDFDIIQVGPYEVIQRGHSYISDIVPTPIFPIFFYSKRLQGTFCHGDDSPDIQLVHPKVLRNFEMSHSYDQCVRDEINPPINKAPGDLTLQTQAFQCNAPGHPKCFPVPEDQDKRYFELESTFGGSEDIMCPTNCPEGPTTAQPPTKKGSSSIFKRHHHGGMLIMTNFCLMPVCSFIARFYKETFNISRIKGVKAWFWAHLIGSGISTILIYFATFHAGKDFNRIPHVYIGKAYIVIIATTWFSAWGRHKTPWINKTAEFFHGVLGYVSIVLAHITMHFAPGVGWIPKLLVDTQIGIHVIFIIIMTVHVHMLDKKFGMRPPRRHLPTVEARFDDIPLPQYKFRVATLIVLTFITFVLSFVSLFVE